MALAALGQSLELEFSTSKNSAQKLFDGIVNVLSHFGIALVNSDDRKVQLQIGLSSWKIYICSHKNLVRPDRPDPQRNDRPHGIPSNQVSFF